MNPRRYLLSALILMVVYSEAFGQSPAGPGRVGFGSYSGGDLDIINLYNGNLMLNLPVFSLPGREGMSTTLQLTYNAQGWRESNINPTFTFGTYEGGWAMSSPVGSASITPYLMDCYFNEGVGGVVVYVGVDAVWTDPSGAKHVFEPWTAGPFYAPAPSTCYEITGIDPQEQWDMDEGNPLTNVNPDDPVTAFIKAGYQLTFRLPDGRIVTSEGRLETRNGNYADFDGLLLGDTLGRTVALSIGTISGTETYTRHTIKDSDGTDRDYTLVWKMYSVHDPIENNTDSIKLLEYLILPDERRYEFTYDHAQGYLTKVTLPSGGYIEFDYVNGNSSTALADDYVVARRVSADGSTPTTGWTYDRSTSGSNRIITVTDPENHVIVHTFNSSGYETQTVWKNSAAASASQTKDITRASDGQPNTIVTTVDGWHQEQVFSWAGDRPQWMTQSDWYTGSSATPLTKTIYTYRNSYPYLIKETELQAWNGSSYVTQGRTVLEYDEYSVASVTGTVPQHHSPVNSSRANVTTIKRYRDASNYIAEHLYYDELGNVVKHVDAREKETTFSFADNFSVSQSVTTYAYPTLITNAEQHTTETVYNYETGLPVTVTARNLDTTFTYDLFNRPLTITKENSPSNSVVSYCYDDNSTCWNEASGTLGVIERTTLESGVERKVATFADRLGRPIQVRSSDPDGDVYADTEYDAVGNVKRASAPYRIGGAVVWTETEYDVLGRPTKVDNPDPTDITIVYSDKRVTTIDEAGHLRRQTFNGLGQLTSVEEQNPEKPDLEEDPFVTDYGYYAFGPLKQVTQGSQTRTFTYDWLGRMTSEVHPETGTTTYTHLDNGLVASRTVTRDASTSHTVTTDYDYDDIGRLLKIEYTDSTSAPTPKVTYTYDENGFEGFLTKAEVDGLTTSTFEYDLLGNLTEENVTLDGVGTFTTGYTYDLGGRLRTVTYPSERTVTQTYAAGSGISNSRLLTLTDSPTLATLVQSVSANAAGAITGRTLSGGIAESRTFNSRNQLTGITAAANSATLLNIGYGYGANNDGRIRSRADAVQPEHSAAYTFDTIGRLKAVSGGDDSWGISWVLDRFGNREQQTPTGLAVGQLGSPSTTYVDNKDTHTSVEYDDAGNLIRNGSDHFYYDAENRLVEINSDDVQYAYDYAGRRIKRKITKDSNTVTTYYFYGLTGLMSEFSTESGASGAALTDRLQYRVGEQTGTAVMLLDSSGTPRENNRVFPFGEPWSQFANSNNTEKFTTYQHDNDDDTDLDYAMARYYASRSGRFMTPDPGHVGADPKNPQSWNAYAYAGNDPVNKIDPTGLLTEEESCTYDWDTETYSFACPGWGDSLAEAIAHWEKLLAWTLADAQFASDTTAQVGGLGRGGGFADIAAGLDYLWDSLLTGKMGRKKCLNLFAKLGMTGAWPTGLTPFGLVVTAQNAVVVDGLQDQSPFADLWANTGAYATQQGLFPQATIASEISSPGRVALAELSGHKIAVNLTRISRNRKNNGGLLGHESFHNAGWSDQDIQMAWFGNVNLQDTDNIRRKFQGSCL